ncbi:MAG TPA: helix-turn-helix domain-containing protein [Candidatus Ligilactobacillus excrementipullorum]|nr:helix-turn-helix domain-containing protein [Candidatus Ligilactobacillus excrementipullorum]
MMVKKRKFYNPELETTELYTEVWRPELVTVKDVTDLLVINHYWQDSDGELWGDFTDPMENVREAFDAYRERQDYLKPVEIKKIRHDLGMTVREFADFIGIGSSTLTQIENNKRLQVKYQENLFRFVKNRYENGEKLRQNKNKTEENKLTGILSDSPYQVDHYEYETENNYKDSRMFDQSNKLGDAV